MFLHLNTFDEGENLRMFFNLCPMLSAISQDKHAECKKIKIDSSTSV